jgi:hypothetical protein
MMRSEEREERSKMREGDGKRRGNEERRGIWREVGLTQLHPLRQD